MSLWLCLHCTVVELECRNEDPTCSPAAAPLLLLAPVLEESCSPVSGRLITIAAEDGTVLDSPPSTFLTGGIVNIGDLAAGETMQLFLSFDLTSIQGGTVNTASLSIHQSNANGTPTNILPFYVDHVDFGTLDNSDHGTTGLAPGFHEINDVSFPSFKVIDVTATLQADLLAGRPRSQYRIRATSNGDALADSISLHTGNAATDRAALDFDVCL